MSDVCTLGGQSNFQHRPKSVCGSRTDSVIRNYYFQFLKECMEFNMQSRNKMFIQEITNYNQLKVSNVYTLDDWFDDSTELV